MRTAAMLMATAVLVFSLSAAAFAANPDSNPNGSHGGCSFSGFSWARGDSTASDDFSQTGQPTFAYCPAFMQVYAYFCDSTANWGYRESQWVPGGSYGAVNTPQWGYWSNRVYGYHWIQQPSGSYSGKITTDGFISPLTCS